MTIIGILLLADEKSLPYYLLLFNTYTNVYM